MTSHACITEALLYKLKNVDYVKQQLDLRDLNLSWFTKNWKSDIPNEKWKKIIKKQKKKLESCSKRKEKYIKTENLGLFYSNLCNIIVQSFWKDEKLVDKTEVLAMKIDLRKDNYAIFKKSEDYFYS